MHQNTIRVAVFPGGGVRGYCGIRAYEAAVQLSGLTSQEFADSVDVYCGTSIGSISACAFRVGKTPAEMKAFLRSYAKRIFTSRTTGEVAIASHNASTDSLKLTAKQKTGLLLVKGEPFYYSPYPDSDYGHNVLHEQLVNVFGTTTLASIPVNQGLLVPAVNLSFNRLDIFANHSDTNYVPSGTLVDICRASSAAPFYLPKYSFGGSTYWDGGLAMNDPVAEGVLLARLLKPRATRMVVMVFGTGYGTFSFDDIASIESNPAEVAASDAITVLNISMYYSELNYQKLATMLATRYVSEYNYYKFNPFLAGGDNYVDSELDNSRDAWFDSFDTLIDAELLKEQSNLASIVSKWVF